MRSVIMPWIAALALTCFAASSVGAEVVTFKSSGGWQAFGGRSEDNRKVCGVSADGGGRWLGVKYYEGDDGLTLQLSKNTWTVRNGAQIDIKMQFDYESPWTARARAFHMSNGDGAIQFSVGRKQILQWLKEFKASNMLYVRFPGSDVEDWQADLSGTEEIVDALGLCLQAMSNSQ
jgi:hypothetical protein